jgi:hypothetical protein
MPKPNEKMTINWLYPPSTPHTPRTWFKYWPRTTTHVHITARDYPSERPDFDYTRALRYLLVVIPLHFPVLKNLELDITWAYFGPGDEGHETLCEFVQKGVRTYCEAWDNLREEMGEENKRQERYENREFISDSTDDDMEEDDSEEDADGGDNEEDEGGHEDEEGESEEEEEEEEKEHE